MSTIKINELATSSINLSDFIVKADSNGLATKNTVQGLADVISTVGNSEFKGSLAIADTPSANGWYFPSESGTYTNAGDVVVSLENNLNIIIVSGTQDSFELLVIPIILSLENTFFNKTDNTNASTMKLSNSFENSKKVFKYSDDYIVTFGDIIKNVSLIGNDLSKEYFLARLSYRNDTNNYLYIQIKEVSTGTKVCQFLQSDYTTNGGLELIDIPASGGSGVTCVLQLDTSKMPIGYETNSPTIQDENPLIGTFNNFAINGNTQWLKELGYLMKSDVNNTLIINDLNPIANDIVSRNLLINSEISPIYFNGKTTLTDETASGTDRTRISNFPINHAYDLGYLREVSVFIENAGTGKIKFFTIQGTSTASFVSDISVTFKNGLNIFNTDDFGVDFEIKKGLYIGFYVTSTSEIYADIPDGITNSFLRASDINNATESISESYYSLEYSVKVAKGVSLSSVLHNLEKKNSDVIGLNSINWEYNDSDATVTGTELFKQFTVLPNVDADNGTTVGCTGSSYNEDKEEYAISYYNFNNKSQLWLYKREDLVEYSSEGTITPVPSSVIDLTSVIDHIQGNAYDYKTKSYWIIGTKKGESQTDGNNTLIRVDETGSLLEEYYLSDYSFQVGMIVINHFDDTLIIKPNNRSFFVEINKNTKALVRQVTTFNSQEGLGFDSKNKDIYLADLDGNLKQYSYDMLTLKNSFTFETLPNETNTENVESIIIDPIDDTIIMVADAYLHGANNNGNCMWVYDFNKKINKSINTPYMYGFESGKVGNKVSILDNKLTGVGQWESLILDFESFTDFINNNIVVDSDLTYTVEYRGSDTIPSSTITTRTNWRDKSTFKEWGTTSPSNYSSSVPSKRYVQIRLNLI